MKSSLILSSVVVIGIVSAGLHGQTSLAKTFKPRLVKKVVKVKSPRLSTAPVDSIKQTQAATIPVTSMAAGTTQSPVAVVADPAKKAPSRFKLEGILGVTRDLRVTDHPDHSSSMLLELDPSYKLSDNFTAVGIFSATKSFTGDMETVLGDGTLGISKSAMKLEDSGVLGFSPRVYSLLPLSEKSRDVNSLRFGLVGAGRFLVTPKGIFKMYYQPSVTRYFNEFRETTTGSLNKAWKLKHKGNFDLDVGKGFSLNLVLEMSSVWNYDNDVSNDFNADQSVGYEINKNFSLSLGHTTTGDFWNEDRSDTKFSLTDNELAEVYFALNFSF